MKHKSLTYVPILLLAVALLLYASDAIIGAVQQVGTNVFLSVFIVQLLVLLVPMAFYCGLARRSFLKVVPLRGVRLTDVPFVLWLSLAFLFGAATVKYLTCAFFTEAESMTSSLISVSLYTTNTPLVILCFILLPALLEQALFSGLLVYEYRPYGKTVALLFCALCYAMCHFSFVNFGYYFFFGLCMGLLALLTDSLLPGVLLSALSFAADVYLEDVFFEYVSQTGSSVLLFYFFCGLFLLFSFFCVSSLEKSYARRARSVREGAKAALEEAAGGRGGKAKQTELTLPARIRLVFLSPTLILFVVLFVLFAAGVF